MCVGGGGGVVSVCDANKKPQSARAKPEIQNIFLVEGSIVYVYCTYKKL